MALKQIKNKIISTKKTGKVTKAMEAVSAVKMRKSQERAFLARPYVHTAMRILNRLAASRALRTHALSENRAGNKVLLLVITSDKGLAGSVNGAVLRKVEEYRKSGVDFSIISVGRKAVEYAERNNLDILGRFTNVSDGVQLNEVEAITKLLTETYLKDKTNARVEVIYQNFISTFEQLPTKRQIIPLLPGEVNEILIGIRPKTGKFSHEELAPDTVLGHTVEPGEEEVINTLLPQLIQILIFHAFLESKACEHSARMVAMKNATDKSGELVKALTIKFNKARQAAITAEVSEITAGAEAMK